MSRPLGKHEARCAVRTEPMVQPAPRHRRPDTALGADIADLMRSFADVPVFIRQMGKRLPDEAGR